MEELVIRDADVVDGSGGHSYRADVVKRAVSTADFVANTTWDRLGSRRRLVIE